MDNIMIFCLLISLFSFQDVIEEKLSVLATLPVRTIRAIQYNTGIGARGGASIKLTKIPDEETTGMTYLTALTK
jgi:hypothetical protein